MRSFEYVIEIQCIDTRDNSMDTKHRQTFFSNWRTDVLCGRGTRCTEDGRGEKRKMKVIPHSIDGGDNYFSFHSRALSHIVARMHTFFKLNEHDERLSQPTQSKISQAHTYARARPTGKLITNSPGEKKVRERVCVCAPQRRAGWITTRINCMKAK